MFPIFREARPHRGGDAIISPNAVDNVIQLLTDRAPEWPRVSHRCTNDPDEFRGLTRRDLEAALHADYWQFSPSAMRGGIVLDFDTTDPLEPVLAGKILPPTCIFWNANHHPRGHAYYALENPVCHTRKGRQHPIRYMDAVRKAMTRVAGADPRYTNYLAKGPLHKNTLLEVISGRTYDLVDLARGLDLSEPMATRSAPTEARHIEGRHDALFNHLREEMYGWTKKFRDADQFRQHLTQKAEEFNRLLTNHPSGPLPVSHLRSTVNSVWRYATGNKHTQPRHTAKVPGAFDRSRLHSADRPPPAPEDTQKAMQKAAGEYTAQKKIETTTATLRAAVMTLRTQGQPVTAKNLMMVTGLSKNTVYTHSDVWN